MAEVNPLAQLKDIHLPSPVGWWPLAPGWYLLGVLILLFTLFLVHYFYKKHRHALAKKQALLLLNQYQNEYELKHNVPITSAHISELLRRVALVYFPRNEVASLHGEKWIEFLNNTGKGVDFNSVKDMLLDAPFKTMEKMDLKPLFSRAQIWIKQRKIPCSN